MNPLLEMFLTIVVGLGALGVGVSLCAVVFSCALRLIIAIDDWGYGRSK